MQKKRKKFSLDYKIRKREQSSLLPSAKRQVPIHQTNVNSFLPSLAKLEANCCILPRFVAGWLLAGKEPSAQRPSAGFDFSLR